MCFGCYFVFVFELVDGGVEGEETLVWVLDDVVAFEVQN